MADEPDQPGSNPQVPSPPAPSAPPRPKIKQADRYSQHRLARVFTLPQPILNEAIRRLQGNPPSYGPDSIHELELSAFLEDKVAMPLQERTRLLQTLAMLIEKGLKAEADIRKTSGSAWGN
jgi:hypothetical protein